MEKANLVTWPRRLLGRRLRGMAAGLLLGLLAALGVPGAAAWAQSAVSATTATRSAGDPEIDRAVQEAAEFEARGDVDGALRRLHDAALLANADRRSELYVRAARALAARHRWEDALAEGYAGIAASPRSGWTYLEVAKILAQAGRRAAAVEMAEEAASRDAQVRFAALDFIAEVKRREAAGRTATASAPAPAPGAGLLAGGIAAALALLGGGLLLLYRRRRRRSKAGEKTLSVPRAGESAAPAEAAPPAEGGAGASAGAVQHLGRTLGTGDFIGGYRVDRVVATSLHSTLYRAEDVRLARMVAIKQANPMGMQSEAALLRFQKEVQSLIALSTYHDGVSRSSTTSRPERSSPSGWRARTWTS
ncbi:MAG: hypothetical protein FJZ01_10620 [Candidatus Sericytochromatia bacterium]|nr:hypothetical protein [Candidatus Tanganyikabacteria bacterium]